MLMGAHDGAVYIVHLPIKLACGVGLLLDRHKETFPDACLPPTVEAAGHGLPRPIAFR
jgi:hypothetical protein